MSRKSGAARPNSARKHAHKFSLGHRKAETRKWSSVRQIPYHTGGETPADRGAAAIRPLPARQFQRKSLSASVKVQRAQPSSTSTASVCDARLAPSSITARSALISTVSGKA